MNEHATDSDLSAYLDGELEQPARARVEDHLLRCEQCLERRGTLEQTVHAVASLPEVSPTADESRAIRLAIIESRKARPKTWRFWTAIAGSAAIVAGVTGAAILARGPGSGPTTTASEARLDLPEQTLVVLATGDNEEIRHAVTSLPEFEGATERFRVADVGAEQSESLEAFAFAIRGASASAEKSDRSGEAAGAPARVLTPAPAQLPEVPLHECLRTILLSQPYPMMPVAARPALFKGTPSWLLVYAFTRSARDDDPLDRVQVWLVDRRTCSQEPFLHYFVFKP